MLELPTRRSIVAYIGSHPGSSARAIQRGCRLGWGETAYHLRKLVGTGDVEREREGRRDFYFLPAMGAEDRKILMAMRGTVPRRILLSATAPEGRAFREIVSRVGEARSTVAFHLRLLLLVGRLESDGSGTPRYRARAPDRVRALAREYPPEARELSEGVGESFGGLVRD